MEKLTPDLLGEDVTDRERLALAFGILRENGWFAPTEWSSTLCCTPCGWKRVCERFGIEDDEWDELPYDKEPLSVWWHSQGDSVAFCGADNESPLTDSMHERIVQAMHEHPTSEEKSEWLADHRDEIIADERIARLTLYSNLICDLSLHWSGSMMQMRLAVATLRSVGLVVTEPNDPAQCITVHPRTTQLRTHRRGDGRVAVWFGYGALDDTSLPSVVLSEDDLALLRGALDSIE
jgi:hypothetical protein